MKFKINENLEKLTFDQVLNVLHLGKKLIYEIKKAKLFLINDAAILPNDALKLGDSILLKEDSPKNLKTPIFENEYIACFNKQAGELMHTDGKNKGLIDTLGDNYYIVHRLDKETSGLVLFSKSKYYKRFLDYLFRENKIIRKYRATLETPFYKTKLVIKSRLFYDKHQKKTFPSNRGRLCETWVFKTENPYIVDIEIKTGITHQIRAHLRSEEFIISGDQKYGSLSTGSLKLKAHYLEYFCPFVNKKIKINLKGEEDEKN